MIEVAFKVYFTFDHFISHKIEVLDAIIVVVSFILDLVFLNDDAVGGIVGLLTLLRLWRVLRVINGFILGAKQAADKRVHEQKRIVQELEKEIEKLKSSK